MKTHKAFVLILFVAVLLFSLSAALASEPKESPYPQDFFVQSSGIHGPWGYASCWMLVKHGTKLYTVRDVGLMHCHALNPQQYYQGKFLRGGRIELRWCSQGSEGECQEWKTSKYIIELQNLGQ